MFRTEPKIQSIFLNSEKEPFISLRKTFEFVESSGWDEARLFWLITHDLLTYHQSNEYNLHGSVDENVLRFIKNPVQLYKNKSTCSRQDCAARERTTKNTNLAIE